MPRPKSSIKNSIVELIELASVDNHPTHRVLNKHRQQIVTALKAAKQIDNRTADYLLE